MNVLINVTEVLLIVKICAPYVLLTLS